MKFAQNVLTNVPTGRGDARPGAFRKRAGKTLAPPRWNIVETMTGAGPMSIREVARRVGRDVKAVHGDVKKLLDNGVLDRTEDGKVVFPYDAAHVDFVITKAA